MTQIKITEWKYGVWARSSARAGVWAVACARDMTMARNYKLVDIGDLIHDSN